MEKVTTAHYNFLDKKKGSVLNRASGENERGRR